MKITLCLFVLFSLIQKSYAWKVQLNPSIFDTSLIKNASVIKNEENILLEITAVDRFTYTVHKVETILSEKGKDELDFVQYTNKYISLENAEIKVLDVWGKQVTKFSKKDMTTVANGEGLIEDGYVTYLRIPAPAYPITIEYNYQLKFKGTVNYPSFNIMSSGEAVVKSIFTARVLKELDLRYKEKNVQLKPDITEDTKYKQYQWTITDMKPLEYEEGTAKYESRYPSIQLAPNRFSYYNNEGDLTSWKKFGAWIGNLYNGLDELPQERKDFFINMVKGASTDEEKARIIYEYLQKNFRYVSIQLGIGGLKPFSADFTDKKKYGDCKGLSNFMKAALKAVGIKSCLAIINAEYNSEPVDPDFPENGFNHVILCIPQAKDSIWLECTSNKTDFGVLGSFTENRNALLITNDGGVLVPTPVSQAKENVLTANTLAEISEDGSGTSVSTFTASGAYKEDIETDLIEEKKDDQKEFLIHTFGFKQPDEFEIGKNDNQQMLSTSIKMTIEKIPEFVAGDKMFIAPRLYKQCSAKLPKSNNRRLDFYFFNPFIKTDTTVYKLPEGFVVDALPSAKSFACEYGSYKNNYWFDAKTNLVYSTAKLELTQLKIPASKYASVKTFFDEVLQEDAQRIVIKKNN
jgi:transglutaminase-like putative cysteine protease